MNDRLLPKGPDVFMVTWPL